MLISTEYNKLLEKRKKIGDIVDWDNIPVIQEMIKLFTCDIAI